MKKDIQQKPHMKSGKIFVIATEGKKTEPYYFEILNIFDLNTTIKIVH